MAEGVKCEAERFTMHSPPPSSDLAIPPHRSIYRYIEIE